MVVLPPPVEHLAHDLARMPGVVAVTLGGSRATGAADLASDWDLGVYYRGGVELERLARRGTLHPPGSWGRIMNGGAWLRLADATKVDVLLRDLDVVVHWTDRARQGSYEVDNLLGYLAGAPTYSLTTELAIGRLLVGSLPRVGDYPSALAETGRRRWRFSAEFTLDQARMRAERGDVVGTLGQLAKATVEEAHARLCERREWVLNEKRIVERAGLDALHRLLAGAPADADGLVRLVEAIAVPLLRPDAATA